MSEPLFRFALDGPARGLLGGLRGPVPSGFWVVIAFPAPGSWSGATATADGFCAASLISHAPPPAAACAAHRAVAAAEVRRGEPVARVALLLPAELRAPDADGCTEEREVRGWRGAPPTIRELRKEAALLAGERGAAAGGEPWRGVALSFAGQPLDDDSVPLSACGIGAGAEVAVAPAEAAPALSVALRGHCRGAATAAVPGRGALACCVVWRAARRGGGGDWLWAVYQPAAAAYDPARARALLSAGVDSLARDAAAQLGERLVRASAPDAHDAGAAARPFSDAELPSLAVLIRDAAEPPSERRPSWEGGVCRDEWTWDAAPAGTAHDA